LRLLGQSREQSRADLERVMQAYGLMVNLTIEQEDDACERFEIFLQTQEGNGQELAVQALQFLPGNRPGRQCLCQDVTLVWSAYGSLVHSGRFLQSILLACAISPSPGAGPCLLGALRWQNRPSKKSPPAHTDFGKRRACPRIGMRSSGARPSRNFSTKTNQILCKLQTPSNGYGCAKPSAPRGMNGAASAERAFAVRAIDHPTSVRDR
jgi:hypothetical protein